MKCDCGAIMIKRYENSVLPSYPPQYPWQWWCKCGKVKPGGVERGKTEDEVYAERWEAAQE